MTSGSAFVPVRITRLRGGRDLPLPSRATPGSAGFDLHAALEQDLTIEPSGRVLVPTGLSIAVPVGYEAQVRPRSGLALRHGIVLPNAPGTIDSDYRGEIRVILMNASDEPYTISRGDRVAQLVIAPVAAAVFEEVHALEGTPRGSGGFGHTGAAAREEERE